MTYPDINGAWLSKGNLVYIVTQVDDRFVWRVVHHNGVIETGIGSFENGIALTSPYAVHAKWNFHGGNLGVAPRDTSGRVICDGNMAVKIEWNDDDHFSRIC